MGETSDGEPQFRSSIMRNLYEMYKNPLTADVELLASGEKNLTIFQKTISSFLGSVVTAFLG